MPSAPGVARRGQVVGELDVRVEPDAARRRRSTPGAARSASTVGRRPVIVGVMRGAREHPRRRIDDHLAGGAVDDDQLPGLHQLARVVQADDGGHVERARENRGVIRAAAGVGGEAADLGPVDLRGERRRQLVGDQHRRLVELAQQIARRRRRPRRRFIRSRPTRSATSPLRSRRYGSATSSKTALNSSNTCCTAHSALTRCSRTMSAARGTQHRIVEHQQLRVEERRQLRPAPRARRRARMSIELLAATASRLASSRASSCSSARRRDRDSAAPARAGSG